MVDNNRKESIKLDSEWVVYWRLTLMYANWFCHLIVYFTKQLICGFGLFKNVPEKDIQGQLALITGSSNGIGRALSIEFAKRKCNIALVDIDEVNGKELAEELKNVYKIRTKFYKVDVSIYEDVEKLKTNIEKDLGYVNILVNNAALIQFTPTLLPTRRPEHISKLIDVNLKGYIWTIKIFLPGMIERKQGHIVATCSLAGLIGSAYILDYTASKCGVRYFMESLYLELLVKGYSDIIKISTIYPSLVLTSNSVIKTIRNTKSSRLIHPWSAEKAGSVAIKGILKNERFIVMPSFYKLLLLLQFLPYEAVNPLLKDLYKVEESGFEQSE